MATQFADVLYKEAVYWDAELIQGIWYFEDDSMGTHPFFNQGEVVPLSEPQPVRRHAVEESGRVTQVRRGP